jgi:hypothetical protein
MFMARRPVARAARLAVGTAVVAGTAGVVNHHMNQHYANQANAQANAQAQQQQMADLQAQQEQLAMQQQMAAQQQAAMAQQAPAAPLPSSNPMDDQVAEIRKFAALKDQGLLTEEEFQAKKKQILGI